MAIYGVANKRSASNDWDYIYGIQQIFGFRLGQSAVGVDPTRNFTRSELEDQLGESLNYEYPVVSQLYVFTEPVEFGKGWHVSLSSAVPQVDPRGNAVWPPRDNPRCSVSTRNVNGLLWGYLEGVACSFADLVAACTLLDSRPQVLEMTREKSTLTIEPDITEELNSSPEILWIWLSPNSSWGPSKAIRALDPRAIHRKPTNCTVARNQFCRPAFPTRTFIGAAQFAGNEALASSWCLCVGPVVPDHWR